MRGWWFCFSKRPSVQNTLCKTISRLLWPPMKYAHWKPWHRSMSWASLTNLVYLPFPLIHRKKYSVIICYNKNHLLLSSNFSPFKTFFFSINWRSQKSAKNRNKAGYTATSVACRWAGAIFEVSGAFGQERYSQKTHKRWKSKVWRTDQRTDKAGCRVA